MILLETHILPIGAPTARLSDYAAGMFRHIPTRKGMKKAIGRGEVFVNGTRATTGKYVRAGDVVELYDAEVKVQPRFDFAIEVIYEDEDLAVVNKPAGLVTAGHQFRTLQHCLPHNLRPSNAVPALKYPRPVHRLDAPTSGLVIVAKTPASLYHLGEMFALRKVEKTYRAVVIGRPAECGTWDAPIEEKPSLTHYQTLQTVPSLRNKHLSLLQLSPLSGRTHQIRKHTSDAGFPIFGDKIYGTPGEIYHGKGLFLAAVGLRFSHPLTGRKIDIFIETPPKFLSLLRREARRFTTFNAEE